MAVFYRPSPHFVLEAVRQFGLNVVSFHLATGARQWYIIGCYLAPDKTSTIERMIAALKERPRGTALLMTGGLNTRLTDPKNEQRGIEIAAALTEEGLKDMAAHFLPRQRKWGR